MTLSLPGVQLDIAVVDAQGRPIAEQVIQLNATGATAEWDVNTWASARTDDIGRFSAVVFAGSGELVVYAGNREIHIPLGELCSQSLLVTVPAAGDATRLASLFAGQTLSTDIEGNGARAWDPIETTLTSPNSGDARIVEGPVTEAAPAGYQLLAQQVTTTTRASTTRRPWRVDFQIDASLFEDAGDVELFSAGSLVRGCRVRNGQITPDPCVAESELGDEGVLELTVLSSHPTRWTFGVPTRRAHGFGPVF
jgi:hypothetical protein